VWQCGVTKSTIPRHREINELTAGAIFRGIGGPIGSRMVVNVRQYTARCQRSGDWWAISVPELKGVNTQARRLEKKVGSLDEVCCLGGAHNRSLSLQFLCLAPHLFSPALPSSVAHGAGRVRPRLQRNQSRPCS